MRRYRFFIDLNKEETWLKNMARNGWALCSKGLGYTFERAEPADTIIRIDYRQFSSEADYLSYRSLFEDSGWQHIAGSRRSGAQYFKRKADCTSDDIFSDAMSGALRYKKISGAWLSIAVTYIPLLVVLISTGAINLSALAHPKTLYLTPGLWEKVGMVFWKAFLFETPFALLRLLTLLILPALIAVYVVFALKAERLYRGALRSER